MVIEEFSEEASAFLAPVNIGIINVSNDKFIAIDTGIDNSGLNKIIKSTGKTPEMILITHHHSDHMGGARKYCGKIPVYCPLGELGLIQNPLMEPTIFFGAIPPSMLRNKYLMARGCPTAALFNTNALEEIGITLISTPGHSLDLHSVMIGHVLFASDSFLPKEIIERHGLLFLTHPSQATASMEQLLKYNPSVIIPGHGKPIFDRKEMKETITSTIEHVQHVKNTLLATIGEKNALDKTVKEGLKAILGEEVLREFPMWRYFLNRHVILNYIAELEDEKTIELYLKNHTVWIKPR